MMRAAVASSAAAVPYSRIRELAEIALSMKDVLRLYFGEATQPTPEFIKEAAQRAMAEGYTKYTPNAGLMSTREAVAAYYARMHRLRLDPSREVIITNSGVQALNVALRCVLNPGDEGIVLTPAWPNACAIIQKDNGRAVEIAHPLEGTRYGIDFDRIEASITSKTRVLVYTSPSNPTGWVATIEQQQRLIEIARRYGLWLLADEVYERLSYVHEGPAPSILQLAERDDAVIVVQSFSKAYCMTGWRLGWLVARADLTTKAGQLNEFTISCAPSFVQRAGETALAEGEEFIRQLRATLIGNRDYCAARLREIPGLVTPEPDGAFYLFPRVEGLEDSFGYCMKLLHEKNVGLAPGVAFGSGGEGSIRLCYAVDRQLLEAAMSRLESFQEAAVQ